MLFLKDVVSHRKLHANLSPKKKQPSAHEHKLQQQELVSDSIADESNSSNQHGSDLFESSSDVSNDTTVSQHSHPVVSEMQPPPSYASASRTKLKRKFESSSQDPFLDIEKQKIKLLSENSLLKQNPDYLFLQSLLPYLMKIPENRKLEVRNKIQNVLIDEQSRQTSYTSVTHPLASPSPSSYSSTSSAYSSTTSPVCPQQGNSFNEFNQETQMDSVQTYFTSFS
ncbi:hypothetical protein LSTR_LSTR000244 [Laodelphax striatellus]|nr:hypothetical protein LSTR_LSTR000244 [Laodelphax striatellus]